jgi:hypothetical protein
VKPVKLLELIDSERAAKILDIPILALGQMMFDGKITIYPGFMYNKEEVIEIAKKEDYLKTLR